MLAATLRARCRHALAARYRAAMMPRARALCAPRRHLRHALITPPRRHADLLFRRAAMPLRSGHDAALREGAITL